MDRVQKHYGRTHISDYSSPIAFAEWLQVFFPTNLFTPGVTHLINWPQSSDSWLVELWARGWLEQHPHRPLRKSLERADLKCCLSLALSLYLILLAWNSNVVATTVQEETIPHPSFLECIIILTDILLISAVNVEKKEMENYGLINQSQTTRNPVPNRWRKQTQQEANCGGGIYRQAHGQNAGGTHHITTREGRTQENRWRWWGWSPEGDWLEPREQ